jgi:hypothetical protein
MHFCNFLWLWPKVQADAKRTSPPGMLAFLLAVLLPF